MSKISVVAVETNLLGRTATPRRIREEWEPEHWPFQNEDEAEVVAAFVGDLQEGGAIRFVLRGKKKGTLKVVYEHAFVVPSPAETTGDHERSGGGLPTTSEGFPKASS